MKPEQKVPSLARCRILWNLEITKNSESYFVWIKFEISGWLVVTRLPSHKRFFSLYGKEIIPAPDLSEFWELLPPGTRIWKHTNRNEFVWSCEHIPTGSKVEVAETAPDALADMMVTLLKAGVLKGK